MEGPKLLVRKVVVLGGGVAGLSAAIHLASKGNQVILLEQEATLGGKASEIREDGFRFDTGPSVLTMPDVVAGIFQDAGRTCPIAFEPLAPLSRNIFASGRVLDVYHDWEKTQGQLDPSEKVAFKKLIKEAQKLYIGASETFVFGRAPGILELLNYAIRYGFCSHPTSKLLSLIRSFHPSSDLEKIFLRFATYLGANPYLAPAILHNIAWVELGQGAVFPKGGMHGLVRALEELALDLNVDIRRSEEVTHLEVKGGVLSSVIAGGQIKCDAAVSSLDIIRTYQLLGRRHRLEQAKPSLSGLVVFLAIKGYNPLMAHHTISYPSNYRAEFDSIESGEWPDDPTLYVYLSCRGDSRDAPLGCENWFVMTNAPTFENLIDEERQVCRVIKLLINRGFLKPEQILWAKHLGPSRLAKMAHRGSIYGNAPDSLLSTLRPGNRVPGVSNLTLAGGTVFPGGGVPLALLSGKEAARLIQIS